MKTNNGKHVPRAIFVDLEHTVVDEVLYSKKILDFVCLKGKSEENKHIPEAQISRFV